MFFIDPNKIQSYKTIRDSRNENDIRYKGEGFPV